MTIAEQTKAIENLKGGALREKFREVTGLETRSNNRPYLIKRIFHALQARADSVPDAAAVPPEVAASNVAAPKRTKKAAPAKKEPAAPATAKRERDPRLPAPGTVIEREHEGKTIRVKVLEDGFEFRGKTYRSLSAVAREATGTIWNGLLFFHLIPYAKREKKAA
jgi:hypothetical protein